MIEQTTVFWLDSRDWLSLEPRTFAVLRAIALGCKTSRQIQRKLRVRRSADISYQIGKLKKARLIVKVGHEYRLAR